MVELSLMEILAIGTAFVGLVGWTWTVKNKAEKNEEKIKDNKLDILREVAQLHGETEKKIQRLFQFKDEHEKESAAWRAGYSNDMAEVRGELKGARDLSHAQFTAIGQQLKDLQVFVSRIDQKLNERRTQ